MYYNHDMMDGWGGYNVWSWIFMSLMMLVFILIVVLVVRYFIREWHVNSRSGNALDILKGRYAKGEIDKEEFEEKKKDLK